MLPRDTRFNTPAEMLVRLVFAARYFLFLGAVVFGVSAVRDGSALDAVKAGVMLVAMIAGHCWLKRGKRMADCERALEGMFRGGGEDAEQAELEALLERREALERSRGTPGFDPWAVQAVRREISDYVKSHPGSRMPPGC